MKRVLSVIILGVLMLCLVSCGGKTDISGNDREGVFSELLPSEIYKYILDGNEFSSNITQLEIIRETINDDIYDGTARITLDDENLKRSIELTLHGRKYDNGGWNLESKSIDNEIITEWKDKSIEKTALASIDEYGFSSVSFNSSPIDGDRFRMCKIDVSYSSNYLDITGYVEVKLPKIPKIEENMIYSTYTALGREYNTDNMALQWKIDGTYTCHISDGHKVEARINRIPEGGYSWEAKHRYSSDNGMSEEKYDGSIASDKIVFGSGNNAFHGKLDEIVRKLGIGSSCSLCFSPSKIWLINSYVEKEYDISRM